MYYDLKEYLNLFTIQIQKRCGQRWATFNTFGEKYPHSRNVIIRELKDNNLFFFTHSLSQKVEDIQKNPATSLCWYDHRHSIQLQFYGQTKLANPQVTSRFQQNIQYFRDYQGPKPGTPLTSIIDNEVHFSVLQMQIEELVALRIGKESHQKTKFIFELGEIRKEEIVP